MGRKERVGRIMLKIPRTMVAVDPIGESEKRGSLFIPEQSVSRVKQGIVKYIGREVSDVGIGDYVFFSGYAGIMFRLENEGTLLFLPEDSIIATLSNRTTDIPGLYFNGGNGEYFTATYEQAMQLITREMAKFYVPIKEQQDRAYEGKASKTIKGKMFTVKDQEHMTGPDCFCMEQGAKDYNNGICPKCGNLLHKAYKKTWPETIWVCENLTKCGFNTKESI